MSVTTIDDRAVAISIGEQYPICKNNPADLYNCTRGLWKVDGERGDKARYAFAVFKGEIQEVYEISQWIPANKESSDYWIKRLKDQGRLAKTEGRSGFVGEIAPENIRQKYIGKTLPRRHGGNPILYFNC